MLMAALPRYLDGAFIPAGQPQCNISIPPILRESTRPTSSCRESQGRCGVLTILLHTCIGRFSPPRKTGLNLLRTAFPPVILNDILGPVTPAITQAAFIARQRSIGHSSQHDCYSEQSPKPAGRSGCHGELIQ